MKRYFSALTLSFTLLGILVSSADAQVGRGKFGFGLSGACNMLQSDWKTNDIGYGAAADLSYALGDNWGLVSRLGVDNFYGKNSASQSVLSTAFTGQLGITYEFLRDKPLNPFLFAGAGLVFFYPRTSNNLALLKSGKDQLWDVTVHAGLGFDYFLDESWSIIVCAEGGMIAGDTIDGYGAGGSNDMYGRASMGIRYYLFDRSTVEKIVETVRR